MKATVIAIVNHKGGVGKTVSVGAISYILSKLGKKVLMVDLDAQANLTINFLGDLPTRSIYHALTEKKNLPIENIRKNLDLVPSSLEMTKVELPLYMSRNREHILDNLLVSSKSKYDFIVIDCPPSLGIVTSNALTVADKMYVPMTADYFSAYGLSMLKETCTEFQDVNPGLAINGIFFTLYDTRVKLAPTIEASIREMYKEKVFKTKIRKSIVVSEATGELKSVVEVDPENNASKDYRALVEEILGSIDKK
jgi:chromosome partitioning protein